MTPVSKPSHSPMLVSISYFPEGWWRQIPRPHLPPESLLQNVGGGGPRWLVVMLLQEPPLRTTVPILSLHYTWPGLYRRLLSDFPSSALVHLGFSFRKEPRWSIWNLSHMMLLFCSKCTHGSHLTQRGTQGLCKDLEDLTALVSPPPCSSQPSLGYFHSNTDSKPTRGNAESPSPGCSILLNQPGLIF